VVEWVAVFQALIHFSRQRSASLSILTKLTIAQYANRYRHAVIGSPYFRAMDRNYTGNHGA
jgi:hypothetical protein